SDPPYSKWKEAYRFDTHELIPPAIVKESSGRLVLFFRPWSEPRQISLSHSKDQGGSWSHPITSPLPNPLSGISAFSANSDIVVVYNHTEKHQRWPLSVSSSPNGGKTWRKVKHIDPVQLEVSYPSFIYGNENITHGVYTYNRRMIKYVKFSKDSFN
ncbi:MAG: hypothetical protein F3745_08660, partial [Nitrospinae bacterium]|nr:hypothetical protein [Nitrospinota bacterium]